MERMDETQEAVELALSGKGAVVRSFGGVSVFGEDAWKRLSKGLLERFCKRATTGSVSGSASTRPDEYARLAARWSACTAYLA
jgi:hypothetical protein